MSNNTVEQLAITAGISVEQLIKQLQQAGIDAKNPAQILSHQEKQKLFEYLQQKSSHSVSKAFTSKTQLERRETQTSTLKRRGLGDITITRKGSRFTVSEPEISPTSPEVQADSSSSDLEKKAASVETSDLKSASLDSSPPQLTEEPIIEPEALTAQESALHDKSKFTKKAKTAQKGSKQKSNRTTLKTPSTDNKRNKTPKFKGNQSETSLKQAFEKPTQPIIREILIPEAISVTELAQKMSTKVAEVIKQLMKMGVRATINQPIEQDIAILLVEEMGHTAKPLAENHWELALQENLKQEEQGEQFSRPPIVTIMGHVDHGKTSLLDYIRRTKVATKEAGGITQHIGAYHVNIPKGVLTFLDTPGHAAFTAMRARGAQLTDIVALIVAADDGVMPQTIEAIQHAQAANVPIVVAVNKMDKPGATMDRVQQELSKYELIPEEWGGDTIFVPVSAKTGQGVDALLDALLIQSEMLELKAPTQGAAQGIIVESRLEKGRGVVATVLVQSGMLHKGDILLAGASFGRVRALHNENGKSITEAGPSIPAEILGLSTPPISGDPAVVVANERTAREIALARATAARESKLKAQRSQQMNDIMSQLDNTEHKVLNVILKADVQGSVEALRESLIKLSTQEVSIKPLVSGVGAITESDVNLALASKAIILGFNVRADNIARQLAEQENVIMHYHTVIYELLDQVKQMMSGLLAPQIKETILGLARVQKIFRSAKTGTIAGCLVTEGHIAQGRPIRVLRDNVVIHQGELDSLRRVKDNVNEVRAGTECGISIKNYTGLQTGDIIENYERTTVERTL